MKVREKEHSEYGMCSSRFNMCGLGEVICFWTDNGGEGGSDSMYIKELDVFIEAEDAESGQSIGWKDMRQVFKDRDIITDNYNSYFFEPDNVEDRARGYTE